jgi:geranylgeranyl reductase family protein
VDRCDVAIVGGGPAGSACAWKLRHAGLDVVVVDKAVFPRDKVCAGWITPQVLEELRINPDDYRPGRTFQPITGFRVAVVGREASVDVQYERPISFGIRRCEFDDYLLRRSGARLMLGTPATAIRREGPRWVVNEAVSAPVLVGSGGHFCPVARMLNGTPDRRSIVAAQEAEVAVEAAPASLVEPERPELYFSPDLTGYGWCFRKGEYVNVGFGRIGPRSVPAATTEFMAFLRAAGRMAAAPSGWRWRGHAYLTSAAARRRAVGEGVILAGDAAGLAYPQSGEGIRPAIESGLMAASAIIEANGRYSVDRFESYEQAIRERFGAGLMSGCWSRLVPARMSAALAVRLLGSRSFVRHVVLDRWFLHQGVGSLLQ